MSKIALSVLGWEIHQAQFGQPKDDEWYLSTIGIVRARLGPFTKYTAEELYKIVSQITTEAKEIKKINHGNVNELTDRGVIIRQIKLLAERLEELK